MEKGEYEKAAYEFERFIHFFPDDPQVPTARLLIGVCRLRDRHFDAAREVFLGIVSSEPAIPVAGKALLLLGESYYQQGISTEAAYYLRQVIEKYPQVELKDTALYRLGWIEMQAGRWTDASHTFSEVSKESLYYESAQKLAAESPRGEELSIKSPAYAGTLAALVPGLGHAYVTRYRDAAVAFVLNGLFIWATVESFHEDHEVLGGILGALEIGWYSGNIYSAVNCAHKYNRRTQEEFRNSLKDQFDLNLVVGDNRCVGLALKFWF